MLTDIQSKCIAVLQLLSFLALQNVNISMSKTSQIVLNFLNVSQLSVFISSMEWWFEPTFSCFCCKDRKRWMCDHVNPMMLPFTEHEVCLSLMMKIKTCCSWCSSQVRAGNWRKTLDTHFLYHYWVPSSKHQIRKYLLEEWCSSYHLRSGDFCNQYYVDKEAQPSTLAMIEVGRLEK